VKNIKILTHIDFYKTFFDHDWARRLDELVAETKLTSPVFSLCMYWKAAVNSHAMPWIMVASLKSFSEGYGSGDRSAADGALWHMVRGVPAAMAPHLGDGSAPTASTGCTLWLLGTEDGTNYEERGRLHDPGPAAGVRVPAPGGIDHPTIMRLNRSSSDTQQH
jgi:hypothetical protein